MRYTLALLTHGEAPTLARTLDSFADRVIPRPTALCAVVSGGAALPPLLYGDLPWLTDYSPEPRGFCVATRALWIQATRYAELSDCDYVFWLEHDFEFVRDLDLAQLADALADNPNLTQMALVRNAENAREKALGGLVNSWLFPHTIETHNGNRWLRHQGYFTTNPSLMEMSFMRATTWPSEREECEGKFGIELKGRGYDFGAWGGGEEWVRHIGTRDGFGY